MDRPVYDACLKALEDAHQACFKNEERDILSMSNGPFSKVNYVLGIVDLMERELKQRGMDNTSKILEH